jgi:uncharacterized membrane-anchored protein YitT (DUF2179 family)
MKIDNQNLYEKSALFIWGVFLYALSFSLFFSPNNIITGGSTGLSLIIKDVFKIDTSLFVLIFSVIFLVVGYLTLGKYNTIKTICGVMILPIFMKFTSIFPNIIDLSNISLFLNVFLGGIMMGLGNGIIIRSGFSVGGFQTIYQILNKYLAISIGKATLITNGILIMLGCVFFGLTNVLYAVIALYIASIITDKVMLETSINKTFFIVTKKSFEINTYITDILGRSATIINAKGGFNGDNKKILMCAIPTRQYYQVKEVIETIDENAFFLITDTYEVYGGM